MWVLQHRGVSEVQLGSVCLLSSWFARWIKCQRFCSRSNRVLSIRVRHCVAGSRTFAGAAPLVNRLQNMQLQFYLCLDLETGVAVCDRCDFIGRAQERV